jgi:hypothetical protein
VGVCYNGLGLTLCQTSRLCQGHTDMLASFPTRPPPPWLSGNVIPKISENTNSELLVKGAGCDCSHCFLPGRLL